MVYDEKLHITTLYIKTSSTKLWLGYKQGLIDEHALYTVDLIQLSKSQLTTSPN